MSNFWEKDKPVQADQPPVQKVNFWEKDKPVEQAVPVPVAEVAPVEQPQAKKANLADLVANNPFSSPPGEKPIPPLLERQEYKNLWPETSYLKTPEPAYTLEMPDGQEVLISLDGKSMTGAVYNKKTNTFDLEYEEKQDPVVPSGVSAGGRGFYSPPTSVTKIKKVDPAQVVGYTNAADKLESAKVAFGRSIIPTASGFAGFAGGSALVAGLLGAPETFGASLLPLLGGAVAGFGTGMAGQSFQDRMFPLDKAQQLALDSNPKIAGAAGFAPALIAAPTSPRTWANLASSTPGVAAKAATQLGSNAVMMGALGTGNDVGANLVAGNPALQGVGLGSVLHHTGTGLLLGHPNKLGRAMEYPGRASVNLALKPFGKGDYATPVPQQNPTIAALEAASAEAQAQGQGQPAPAAAAPAPAAPAPAAPPAGSVPRRPIYDERFKGRGKAGIDEFTAAWQSWDAQYGQTHWPDGTPKAPSAPTPPPAAQAAPKPVVEATKPAGNVFELGVADLTERIRFIKGELGRREAEVRAAAEEGTTDTEGQGRVERLKKSLAEAEDALERLKDRNAPRSELPPPEKEASTAEVLAQRKAEFDKITRQLEAAHRSQRSMKGGEEQVALLEAEHEVASTAYEEALAAHEAFLSGSSGNQPPPPPQGQGGKPAQPPPATPPDTTGSKPKAEPDGIVGARKQLAALEANGNGNSKQANLRRRYIRKWEKDNGLPYSVELDGSKPKAATQTQADAPATDAPDAPANDAPPAPPAPLSPPKPPAPPAPPNPPATSAPAPVAVESGPANRWKPRQDGVEFLNEDGTGVIRKAGDVYEIFQIPKTGIGSRERVGYAKTFEEAQQLFDRQAKRQKSPQESGNLLPGSSKPSTPQARQTSTKPISEMSGDELFNEMNRNYSSKPAPGEEFGSSYTGGMDNLQQVIDRVEQMYPGSRQRIMEAAAKEGNDKAPQALQSYVRGELNRQMRGGNKPPKPAAETPAANEKQYNIPGEGLVGERRYLDHLITTKSWNENWNTSEGRKINEKLMRDLAKKYGVDVEARAKELADKAEQDRADQAKSGNWSQRKENGRFHSNENNTGMIVEGDGVFEVFRINADGKKGEQIGVAETLEQAKEIFSEAANEPASESDVGLVRNEGFTPDEANQLRDLGLQSKKKQLEALEASGKGDSKQAKKLRESIARTEAAMAETEKSGEIYPKPKGEEAPVEQEQTGRDYERAGSFPKDAEGVSKEARGWDIIGVSYPGDGSQPVYKLRKPGVSKPKYMWYEEVWEGKKWVNEKKSKSESTSENKGERQRIEDEIESLNDEANGLMEVDPDAADEILAKVANLQDKLDAMDAAEAPAQTETASNKPTTGEFTIEHKKGKELESKPHKGVQAFLGKNDAVEVKDSNGKVIGESIMLGNAERSTFWGVEFRGGSGSRRYGTYDPKAVTKEQAAKINRVVLKQVIEREVAKAKTSGKHEGILEIRMDTDLAEVLGLPGDASAADIARAFKKQFGYDMVDSYFPLSAGIEGTSGNTRAGAFVVDLGVKDVTRFHGDFSENRIAPSDDNKYVKQNTPFAELYSGKEPKAPQLRDEPAKPAKTEKEAKPAKKKYPIEKLEEALAEKGLKVLRRNNTEDFVAEGGVEDNGRQRPTIVVGDTKITLASEGMSEVKGKVQIMEGQELDASGNAIYSIERIVTDPNARGKGSASKALGELTEAADKAGMTLQLEPTPYRSIIGKGPSLTKEQLVSWYKKNGFEQKTQGSDAILIRTPKSGPEGQKTAPVEPQAREVTTESKVAKAMLDSDSIFKGQMLEDAQTGLLRNVSEIAEAAGVSIKEASQVFQKLVRQGLLTAERSRRVNTPLGSYSTEYKLNFKGESGGEAWKAARDNVKQALSDIVEGKPQKGSAEAWADKTIRESKNRLNSGIDPELLAAYAIKGAVKFGRALKDFKEFSREMVNEFGDGIRPHLKAIFEKAKDPNLAREFTEQQEARAAGSKPEPDLKAEAAKMAEEQATQRQQTKEMAEGQKPELSAGGKVWRSVVDHPIVSFFKPISMRMRTVADLNPQSETAQKLVNDFSLIPGTKETGPDFNTASANQRNIFYNKFSQALGPVLRDMRKMSAAELEKFNDLFIKAVEGRLPKDVGGETGEAVKRVREVMNEMHQYGLDAGLEMGKVTDYFPRQINADLVAKDRKGFEEAAAKAYERQWERLQKEGLGGQEEFGFAGDATQRPNFKEMARKWADAIELGHEGLDFERGIFDEGNPATKENFQKNREFTKEEAAEFDAFRDKDFETILSKHVGGLVRRSEVAKRLGADGMGWAKAASEMNKEGVSAEHIAELKSALQSNLGVSGDRLTDRAAGAYNVYNLVSTSAFLKATGLLNLGEAASIGLREGDPVQAATGMFTNAARVRNVLRRLTPEQSQAVKTEIERIYGKNHDLASALAIELGINQIDHGLGSISAGYHMDGAADATGKARRLNDNVYRMYGIHATEVAKRESSLVHGMRFIDKSIQFLEGNSNLQKIFKVIGKDVKADTLAKDRIMELGVKEADVQAFTDFAKSLRGLDGDAQLKKIMSDDPMAKEYRKALTIFNKQSSVQATSASRTKFANDTSFGKLLFQFSTFTNEWSAQHGRYMAETAKKVRNSDGRYNATERLLAAGAAPAYAVAIAGMWGIRQLTNLLTGFEFEDGQVPKWVKSGADAVVYTGILGPSEILYKAAIREQMPAGVIGDWMKKALQTYGRLKENPESDAAQRAGAGLAYRSAIVPATVSGLATVAPNPLTAAASQAVANNRVEKAFSDFVAGDDNTKGASKNPPKPTPPRPPSPPTPR